MNGSNSPSPSIIVLPLNALIVIMVADLDFVKCRAVTNMIKVNHGQYIDKGCWRSFVLISLYPLNLANARRTLRDPDDRFLWRSKQYPRFRHSCMCMPSSLKGSTIYN